jgi:hypothetical protein
VAGLAVDLAAALDPVLLAELAGIQPDPWQRDVLRSRAPRALWLASRQSGKTTTAALLALHRALYQPGSLVLVVSPSERQSKEAFKKVLDLYAALGRPVPATAETVLWLELAGGSRIVSLPGSEKTTRGFSAPALVILDEAARVEDGLFHALSPMLATSRGGRLVALTTPNGQQGWFHEAWTTGGDLWQRTRVPATACSRISAAFLEAERRSLPDPVYRQEYLVEFTATLDAAFRFEDVDRVLSDAVRPRLPELFGAPPPGPALPPPPTAPATPAPRGVLVT